jgi:DNA polymerase-3 subunit alpha
MDKLQAKFLEGAKKHKLSESKAQTLFELIKKFAGYGFNKSHAAAYALVTYQTAYLKAHYPQEFMAALLTSEMGNTDKVVRYISDCREMGIRVLPPDVNESDKAFSVAADGIRFGLAAIKNVGEASIEAIMEARAKEGPYASFFDFCHRVDARKLNKRTIECLIKAGAFDSSGARRAQMAAVLDRTMDQTAAAQRAASHGQTSIFTAMEPETDAVSGRAVLPVDESLPDVPEWDQSQRLKFERELTGFYITAHPLARYEAAIGKFATTTTERLAETADGKEVKLCGIITTIKTLTTKKGDRMAYVQLEDPHGLVEVIVFPDLFRSASPLLIPESVIQVTGTVDRAEKGIRLKGTKIEALPDLQARAVTKVNLRLAETPEAPQRLDQLQSILRRHPGPAAITLTFRLASDVEADTAPIPNLGVLPSERFVAEVEEVLGKDAVALL